MPISSGGHANFAVIVWANFYFLILKIKLWQKIKNLKGKVTTVTQVEAAVEIRVKTATAAANHPKGKMYLLTEIQKVVHLHQAADVLHKVEGAEIVTVNVK